MNKNNSLAIKLCPICKTKMGQELISESDDYRKIKYICPENNCPRHYNSLTESIKVNSPRAEMPKFSQ